jgi:hypothetical protein
MPLDMANNEFFTQRLVLAAREWFTEKNASFEWVIAFEAPPKSVSFVL